MGSSPVVPTVPQGPPSRGGARVLDRKDFPALLDALRAEGYRIIGPHARDGAIVYDEIRSEADLPIGWTDQQEAGTYRLVRREDGALFGYNVGPHSWKKFLFPPRSRLVRLRVSPEGLEVAPDHDEPEVPMAFLGMRACELAALRITDRVFTGGTVDPRYEAGRQRVLRIAVECARSGATCFCVSMRTGPAADDDFDLALTEIVGAGPHRFLLRTGSAAGERLAAGLPLRPAPPEDEAARVRLAAEATGGQRRSLETAGIHDLLLGNLDHPRWEEVATRCLACANCTLACPTCFCSTTEEVPELAGDHVERWRRWDSCFNLAFSQLHATSVRTSIASRYRQWMTHKLASWFDQFGSSGCVGCGRCITWCPVGIDITEEARAIRRSPKPRTASERTKGTPP